MTDSSGQIRPFQNLKCVHFKNFFYDKYPSNNILIIFIVFVLYALLKWSEFVLYVNNYNLRVNPKMQLDTNSL